MAAPCIISYKGKDYSYEDFMVKLHDDLLEELINNGTLEGFDAAQLSAGGRGPVKKQRSFPKQVAEEFPDQADLMKDGTINYDVIPNIVSLEDANTMIDWMGTDIAAREVMNYNNDMPMNIRFTASQILIKKLQEEGNYDLMMDVLDSVSTKATELGQAIQTLAMFSSLTPEGALRYAARTIKKKADKLRKGKKNVAEKVTKELKDINKKAAKQVAESVVKKIGGKVEKETSIEVNPAVEENTEYGATNKVVTKDKYERLKKQIKGKFFTGVPTELVEIAAYHLEASGRKFSGFSKKMIKDFGKKVKPHLLHLYEKAKKELSKEYNDFEEMSAVESEMQKVIGKEFKAFIAGKEISIQGVIEKHYTTQSEIKTSLVDSFMTKLGLSEDSAKAIAKLVEQEFDRLTSEKKKQVIDKLFTPKDKVVNRKKKRTTEEEIVRLSNLGVFKTSDVLDRFADKMGWPKLTEENIKEIEKLGQRVQDSPEGLKRHKATTDLLAYQAKIKGLSLMDVPLAVYYAHILSGYLTHVGNILSSVSNAILLYGRQVSKDPKNAKLLASAFLDGMVKGITEARSTVKTGYSPIRGKAEAPGVLEWYNFKGGNFNPANYLKYVSRYMVAADVIFFEANKEMRAFQLAAAEAVKNDVLPNENIRTRASYILDINDETVDNAMAQAEIEYEQEIDNINKSDASVKEKEEQIKIAKLDKKRRVYELIEQQRSEDIRLQSHDFAARATFNYTPEGTLGIISALINGASKKYPVMKLFVPFVNVIANATNESLNYMPVGALRAISKGEHISGLFTDAGERKYVGENIYDQKKSEKADLVAKALFGTALMTAIYMLASTGGDDDDESVPFIEVTANGSGNYSDNEFMYQKTGYKPFSIRIGDKWISYKETPLFLPLSFIGSLKDYEKYNKKSIKDDETLSRLKVASIQLKDIVFNSTAIAGMNVFMKTILENDNSTIGSRINSAFGNMAKGFVVPSMYTQIARDIEVAYKIPEKETKGTFWGPIVRDIPFLRNMYYDKVGVLGGETYANTDRFVSETKDSKEIDLLVKKNKYFLRAPNINSEKIIDDKTKEQRLMTRNEFYNYSLERSRILSAYINSYYGLLEKMDPDAFEKVMTKFTSSATASAKANLKQENK
jgi:predicted RNA-binding Zn ribbon-like protein